MRFHAQHTESAKRAASIVLLLAAAMVIGSGCGGREGSAGPYKGGLDKRADEQQVKSRYAESFGRMFATIEDAQAPPVQMSINTANRTQLISNAERWDKAIAVISAATPPKDAKAAHEQLVQSMEELSEWNRRIADAAPNRSQTKKLARQAKKSSSAKHFGEAVDKLTTLGYGPSSDEPLSDVGSPTE